MNNKLFLLAAAASFTASAASAQIRFAPEAGLQMATTRYKSDNGTGGSESKTYDYRAGLRIGGIVDIGITEKLSVQPGLFFAMKGFNEDENTTTTVLGVTQSIKDKDKMTLSYLEVPVNVVYTFGEERTGFFINAGPYLGVAINGKVKNENTTSTTTGTSTVTTSNSSTNDDVVGTDKNKNFIKPLDLGLNAGIGYALANGAFIRANYNLGLANIYTNGDSKNSVKNMGFAVTLGFMFGGN